MAIKTNEKGDAVFVRENPFDSRPPATFMNEELWTLWFWFKYLHRIDPSMILKEDHKLAAFICTKIGIDMKGFDNATIVMPIDSWIDRAISKYIRRRWARHIKKAVERTRGKHMSGVAL